MAITRNKACLAGIGFNPIRPTVRVSSDGTRWVVPPRWVGGGAAHHPQVA